MVKLVTS